MRKLPICKNKLWVSNFRNYKSKFLSSNQRLSSCIIYFLKNNSHIKFLTISILRKCSENVQEVYQELPKILASDLMNCKFFCRQYVFVTEHFFQNMIKIGLVRNRNFDPLWKIVGLLLLFFVIWYDSTFSVGSAL